MGKPTVEVPEVEMSPEEKRLLEVITAEYEQRAKKADQYEYLIDEYFQTEFSGELTEEDIAEIDRRASAYEEVRSEPIKEYGEEAMTKAKQRLVGRGLGDSSIAEKAYTDLDEMITQELSKVGLETSLYRAGEEDKFRTQKYTERARKFADLLALSDPQGAATLYGSLAQQRSNEQNQLLQVALANAQNAQSPFLNLLTGAVGAGVGGIVGGPMGAAIGAGVGTSMR